MTDLVFAWLPQYGVPALFATLIATSVGVPFPGTLLLLAVGALVSQDELSLWQVLVFGTAGAIIGDQIGYLFGRWGGEPALERVLNRTGGADRMDRARVFADRWGAFGIFITRWLIGPLGPWINVSSGIAAYPWPRFLFWDVLGDTIWVVLYVMIGKFFSDQVADIADFTTSMSWALIGVLIAAVTGWQIAQHFHHAQSDTAESVET